MAKNPYDSRFHDLYDDPKKEKEGDASDSKSFTVDSDEAGLTEMPGITKLLNRKSLGLSRLANEAKPGLDAFTAGQAALAEKAAEQAAAAGSQIPPPMTLEDAKNESSESKSESADAAAMTSTPSPSPSQGGLHEISLEDLADDSDGPLTLEGQPMPAPKPAPTIPLSAAPTSAIPTPATPTPPVAAGPVDARQSIDASSDGPATLEFSTVQSEAEGAPAAATSTAATIELPVPPVAVASPASGLPPIAIAEEPHAPLPPTPFAPSIPAPPAGATPPVMSKVQPAARTAQRRPAAALILWDPFLLKGGTDPLGRGLAMLLERGATSALYLSILPLIAGAATPQFSATAAVAAKEKLNVWRGLRWDPALVPEVWNAFLKVGMIELGPPGQATNQKSARNMIRAAFGAEAEEFLILLRCGPPNQLRGALAVISNQSLITQLTDALPLIGAPLAKASAA